MTDRTCKTCKHWSQHPWPNRRGWHVHGTCAALQIAPQGHLLNNAPAGHMPMVDTNQDFGCNKWEGDTPLFGDPPEVSIPRFEIDPEALARFELATKWMKEVVEDWRAKE